MRIGIPRESRAGQSLVAATAETADRLQQLRHDVVVQRGAGVAPAQPDSVFDVVGVHELGRRRAEKRRRGQGQSPITEEIARMHSSATVVSLMAPGRSPELDRLQSDITRAPPPQSQRDHRDR